MENTDYQRIEQVRKILDTPTFKDLAEKIGVSPQVFYDIKNGKHGISKKLAEKIHAADERISVPWLLTGDGTTVVGEVSGNVVNGNVGGDVNSNAAIVKALEITKKSQEQIDRLLAIIEKLT